MAIKVFYHIFVNESDVCFDIIKEQVEIIKTSILLHLCQSINCCITGNNLNNYNLIVKYIESQGHPFKILKKNFDDKTYERFTLNEIIKNIDTSDKLLYIHSKGVTKKMKMECLNNWRKMMEYFLIEKADICIKYLDSYDAVGCMYRTSPEPHFSGNFWWSTASYFIKNYVLNYNYLNSGYYYASEFFIGKGIGYAKLKEIYTYNECGYHYNVPREEYIKQLN